MSAVMTSPELMAGGATDLAAIGSTLDAAHLAVAPATVTVPPAAANEVLTAVAQVFSQCAQEYHAVAGQAASFHDQFVQTLSASATSYASAEATNIGLLQPLNLFDSVQSEVLSLVNAVQPVLTGLFAVLNRLVIHSGYRGPADSHADQFNAPGAIGIPFRLVAARRFTRA